MCLEAWLRDPVDPQIQMKGTSGNVMAVDAIPDQKSTLI
jgi:hypothetical protein